MVLLGTIAAFMVWLPRSDPFSRWLVVGTIGACIVVPPFFVVRGYVLAGDVLIVRRSFWNTRIELKGLRSAKADPDAFKGAWKTVGNDGLFAIHGWFVSRRLGKFRAFATRPASAVILDVGEKRIVISPEDPEAFLKAIHSRLRRTAQKS